ncbi:MAG: glycosyl hydrolase family 57 [Candidatus Omnitrophota bacterium]
MPHEIPEIYADENNISSLRPVKKKDVYAGISDINFPKVDASFGIALHMHQPTIPASTDNLHTAKLISNLQYMMEHQNIGDNHNAPVFLNCYSRMSDIIIKLAAEGAHPRVMLDYSGNLLWGLEQMSREAIEKLKLITTDKKYQRCAEWLGTTWSHAVISSTPVPDIKLHLIAWREHFASIFGREAARRVKGFSPPEMHLPIHPDVCFAYVRDLKECGYEWLLAQEHTIENLDGTGIRRPHFPHKLVAKNSLGQTEEITVLIKTQGSDTKLVAQMQPYYEARSLSGRQDYAGRKIPPFVSQIGDGENGGVMMNEFPPAYNQAFAGITAEGVVAMNGSEYLEFIQEAGVDEGEFIKVQPILQHRIWAQVKERSPHACEEAIKKLEETDHNFHLDKASWTNEKSWVRDYEHVLDPINQLSAAFHKKYDGKKISAEVSACRCIRHKENQDYRRALLYLLLSQTSCFRYWGSGIWTDYAKELCRRGIRALEG